MPNRRGLSLPEVMLAAAVSMTVTAVILTFLSQESESWQLTLAQQQLSGQLQQAASEINRELRNATRTAAASPPNTSLASAQDIRFYLPSDLDGNGTILNSFGNIEWDTVNQIQYQFDAANRQLQRRVLQGGNPVAGATRVIGNDITAVSFADQTTDNTLLMDEMRVILTGQQTTPRGRQVSTTLNSVIRLRN